MTMTNLDIQADKINEPGIRQLFLEVLSLTHSAESADPFNEKFARVHDELHDARNWMSDGEGDPDYHQAAINIGRAYWALTGDKTLMDNARSARKAANSAA